MRGVVCQYAVTHFLLFDCQFLWCNVTFLWSSCTFIIMTDTTICNFLIRSVMWRCISIFNYIWCDKYVVIFRTWFKERDIVYHYYVAACILYAKEEEVAAIWNSSIWLWISITWNKNRESGFVYCFDIKRAEEAI